MKLRTMRLFGAIAILVLLLSGCVAPAAPAAPAAESSSDSSEASSEAAPAGEASGVVKVMSFLAADTPEVEPAIIAAFQERNPGITVEFEAVPFGDFFTKLKTLIAGGEAPDVVSLNIENLASFASLGALEDLGPYIERDNFDLGQYYESTLGMGQFDGKQYGLPASFSTVALFYNKNMFDEAGIAYPDETWDWAKLQEEGAKLTIDKDNDGIIDQFGTATAWWPVYLYANNASIFSEDGASCALTEPAAVEAIQKYVNLSLVDKIAPTSSDLKTQSDWDMFMGGRLATFPIGPWALAPFRGIEGFEWDVADMPAMGRQATFLFGNPMAITSDAANKNAAWEYLKFAAGEPGQRIRQAAGFEIAPVKAVAESEFVASGAGLAPEHIEKFLEVTSYAYLPPLHPNWQEIHDSIWPELELALLGQQSVEDALNNACAGVNMVLAGN
jgi:multiple sugar transport system substrate-binding protein